MPRSKITACALFLLLSLNQIFYPALASNLEHTVFQVATIGSLAQGVYDGNYDYGSLMKHGNFGVGTFLDLNGEMVAIDDNFYQIESNGRLKSITAKQIVPFAEVTFFKPTIHKTLASISSYQEVRQ